MRKVLSLAGSSANPCGAGAGVGSGGRTWGGGRARDSRSPAIARWGRWARALPVAVLGPFGVGRGSSVRLRDLCVRGSAGQICAVLMSHWAWVAFAQES